MKKEYLKDMAKQMCQVSLKCFDSTALIVQLWMKYYYLKKIKNMY